MIPFLLSTMLLAQSPEAFVERVWELVSVDGKIVMKDLTIHECQRRAVRLPESKCVRE